MLPDTLRIYKTFPVIVRNTHTPHKKHRAMYTRSTKAHTRLKHVIALHHIGSIFPVKLLLHNVINNTRLLHDAIFIVHIFDVSAVYYVRDIAPLGLILMPLSGETFPRRY